MVTEAEPTCPDCGELVVIRDRENRSLDWECDNGHWGVIPKPEGEWA